MASWKSSSSAPPDPSPFPPPPFASQGPHRTHPGRLRLVVSTYRKKFKIMESLSPSLSPSPLSLLAALRLVRVRLLSLSCRWLLCAFRFIFFLLLLQMLLVLLGRLRACCRLAPGRLVSAWKLKCVNLQGFKCACVCVVCCLFVCVCVCLGAGGSMRVCYLFLLYRQLGVAVLHNAQWAQYVICILS